MAEGVEGERCGSGAGNEVAVTGARPGELGRLTEKRRAGGRKESRTGINPGQQQLERAREHTNPWACVSGLKRGGAAGCNGQRVCVCIKRARQKHWETL